MTKYGQVETHFGLVEIYVNADKEVVVAKKGNVRAKAKCHPRDYFDLLTGVYIATLRLEIKVLEKTLKAKEKLLKDYVGTL